MSLGMVAQVLSALFVLFSGLWAVKEVATAAPMLSWLVVLFGVLGGLTWLAAALTAKK